MRSTSIQSYHEMRDSGLLAKKHANIMMVLVTQSEPITAKEIDEKFYRLTGRMNLQAHKSMRELDALHIVREAGARRCRVTGKTAITWEMGSREEIIFGVPDSHDDSENQTTLSEVLS